MTTSRLDYNQCRAALCRAIDAAGSVTALARAINTTPQRVANWRTRGRVPADMVLAIESATGISRHEIRADVFGDAASKRSRRGA